MLGLLAEGAEDWEGGADGAVGPRRAAHAVGEGPAMGEAGARS